MRVSILLVRLLIEAIESMGISRERFLKATGLDPIELDQRDARISTTDYNRMLLTALEWSGDEAFGLHLGERSQSLAFDLLGQLTDHASTLRQGIETIIRYQCILCDFQQPTLHEQDGRASFRFRLSGFDSLGERIASEMSMSAFLRFIRKFVGLSVRPYASYFAYGAPGYRGEYTRVFDGTERFDHEFTGIEFDRAWLNRTQLFKNPELYSVLQKQAERVLHRLTGASSLTEIVLARLNSTDPKRMPLMKEIAHYFGMSDRSLRRRLVAEGAEYKDLIRQARAHIAKRMLDNPQTSIQETAYAMGFATSAAFHRAFKRWTGMTPKQYRSSKLIVVLSACGK